MNEWSWELFLEPIYTSIKITMIASIIVFIVGFICARWMSKARFPGKVIVESLIMLPLVLPPTVVGFILLFLFGKQGVLGQLLMITMGQSIIFTWWAGVLAAIVVAFPLVYQTIKASLLSIDSDLEDVARSMGANEWQVLRFITVPLSKRMLTIAFVLGFARALGEFGATLMIAGNIPGRTQTIATAIYVAVDASRMTLAGAWVFSMMLFSFMLMYFVRHQSDQ